MTITIALWAAISFVPGIHPTDTGWVPIVILALIFGLINAFLRPLLMMLTCPLILLTLGFGTLFVNTLLFWLAGVVGDYFGVGFTVDSFWAAFFGALVVSIVSTVMAMILPDKPRRRR
jgi:putative membrane protein